MGNCISTGSNSEKHSNTLPSGGATATSSLATKAVTPVASVTMADKGKKRIF